MIIAGEVSVKAEDPTMNSPTSRLNKTPPIGDPKATDIPAAAAAESTSRFRAITVSNHREVYFLSHTFIAINVIEEFHE